MANKLTIKQSSDFNVIFSDGCNEVEVTDYRTSRYGTKYRLPGASLLNIIQNILNETNTSYTVISGTQKWDYCGKSGLLPELFGGCEVEVTLTVNDEKYFDDYSIELKFARGDYSMLSKMLAVDQ